MMTDIVNEYLQKTYEIDSKINFQKVRPRLICKDGFSMSIQAGEYLYSTPRINGASLYTNVEVGYPSGQPPKSWQQYAEDDWGKNILQGFWLSLCSLYQAVRSGFGPGKRLAFRSLFKGRATITIYPYIPIELVIECINLHGGIKENMDN